MIGFDPIGVDAIGELSGDQSDVLIFAPAAFSITVTKAAPFLAGGKSALPSRKDVSVSLVAPAVRSGSLVTAPVALQVTADADPASVQISATVTVPGNTVAVTTAVPRLDAGVLISAPVARSVTVTRVAPFATAGKSQMPATAGVTVAVPPALISISYKAYPSTQQVTVVPLPPQILGGQYIEASNTITMLTPYGEIGSSSIGQFAIGEGEISSRIVKRGPLVIVSYAAPLVTAGKSQFPPTKTVSVISARAEIDSRRRRLRVLAIAS